MEFIFNLNISNSFFALYIESLFSPERQHNIKSFNYSIFFSQTLPLLFGWEYLLRGFILFGFKERFKEASILIPILPFVLHHIGEPEIKILMCIPTGFWFGYIAYRGKSFWPAFIAHALVNVTYEYFVVF